MSEKKNAHLIKKYFIAKKCYHQCRVNTFLICKKCNICKAQNPSARKQGMPVHVNIHRNTPQ